jgi:predicted Ser/Thr protein kinase
MNSALCPTCKTPLPEDAPQGLCPACLMGAMAAAPTVPLVTDAADLQQLAPHFPQLQIEELIGTGGMGRVYRAQQPHLNRTVALKVLTPERAQDAEWLERFSREARALARLSHPHIVQVHDFGEAPMPYLIMEYVDGVNLRQAMDGGGLSAREALAIVPKLCDALHYAHEQGVLHRDIKPENILIDTAGRVKVVDFGLAKLRDENALPFTLTQSGAKLGTLAYMAPEQIEKPADVDHRADIYSLGVVLYEMLTGELPLGRFPAPSEASGVDPRLDGVVMRTLEKRREKRFKDASEMKSGLEHACTGPMPVPVSMSGDMQGFEFRSRTAIGSWPLLHICFGRDPQTGRLMRARGIIAIGLYAQGVVALGVFAMGVLAFGVVSVGLLASGLACLGLISQGVLSAGLFAAYGVMAVAPVALGATALGHIAVGVKAIGVHVAGASVAIEPQAAHVGDRWLPFAAQWSNILHAVSLAMAFMAAVFVSWKARAVRSQAWLLFGSLLIGPVVCFMMPRILLKDSFAATMKVQQSVAEQRAKAEAQRGRGERGRRIGDQARAWMAEANRTDSTEARNKAFQAMLAAIQSDDPEKIEAGLVAVSFAAEVQVDKTNLRDAIRTRLDHPTANVRMRAVSAMCTANYEPVDVERIVAMIPTAEDSELGAYAIALGEFSKLDFTGRFAAPMLSVLERGMALAAKTRWGDNSGFDERNVLRPLWGARFSPEIEAKILEWSHLDESEDGVIFTSGRGYNVFYYALSVQANKSTASVDRVLELAENPDVTNIGGRSLWGLRGTVPDKNDQSKVAAFVIKLLGSRNSDYQWRMGLNLLDDYATKDHAPAIEALAAREAMPANHKERLMSIANGVRQKP